MADERDLPTIKQIIEKADKLHGIPLNDEESKYWFEYTISENCAHRNFQNKSNRTVRMDFKSN
jgi:hypothetical protein